MDDYYEENSEPTKEEWDEIEELIRQEEDDEHMRYQQDKKIGLLIFSKWCKKNGMIW